MNFNAKTQSSKDTKVIYLALSRLCIFATLR